MIPSTTPSDSRSASPVRHAYIDGLRGMAIFGVMIVHFAIWVTGDRPFRINFLQTMCESGARGVQLFFMISAFTLFSSARVRFASDPFPKLNFYVRRAFRILPLWWVAVAFWARVNRVSPWPDWLMYFGFIRFRDGVEAFGMGWSIFVEETFYVLLPLVFERINGLRSALVFAAQMWIIAILWEPLAKKLGVPDGHFFIFQFPLTQWFAIATGIALFFLQEEPLFRRIMLEDASAARLIDAFTAIILFCLIRQGHKAASIGLALLFVACMSPYTLWGKLARNRLLGLFGTCCYSIYLFHYLILTIFERHRDAAFAWIGLGHVAPEIRFFITLPVFAAVCLALGLTLWHGFERPCISVGKRINAALNDWAARRALALKTAQPLPPA